MTRHMERNGLFCRPNGWRLTSTEGVPLMRRGVLVLGGRESGSMMEVSTGLEIAFDREMELIKNQTP